MNESSQTTFHDAPGPARGERVVVGLSGGVDSAVCAHLLAEAGCEVIAVTTRNFCFDDESFAVATAARSCCSQEAIQASAVLSADLGIQHVVLDVEDDFSSVVIEDYVAEYRAGHTPSPCVRCNTRVRFPRLLDFARKVGASRVATGHYARLVEHAGDLFVARGADRRKDQSYFLFRLPHAQLERTLMPLGARTKEDVRALARERGLAVADTPDSQELCFVPDGDRGPLLSNGAVAGEIVDTEGRVLGMHGGVEFFTVGQRRGLGLGGGGTRYVVDIDADTRHVIVGDESELSRSAVDLAEVVWRDPFDGAKPASVSPLSAQTRYRHTGVDVAAFERDDHGLPRRVHFETHDRAPAIGQTLVFYRDDVAVGGGRIVATHR